VSFRGQSHACLTVGRWVSTYSVPASDTVTHDLCRSLDEAETGPLSERCSVELEPVVQREDASVWRIRRLDLTVSLDYGLAKTTNAADIWSRQLACSLAKVIQQREESDAVLRFENYASFVARFVLDLAANGAWGKWYYEEFEDLRIFPPSQAIRAVLLRESCLAADVIVHLASQRNLDVVLAVLTEKDASLIFDSCFESALAMPATAGLDKWAAILLECCVSEPLFLLSPVDGYSCDALRLFARAVLREPGAMANEQLRGAIIRLLELRRVLSLIRSPLILESIIHKAAVGEVDAAMNLAIRSGSLDSADALRFFADRMLGDEDWGREAAAVLLNGNLPARVVSTASVPKGEPFLSPFAGIFLLGPSFLNLRCGQLAEFAAEPNENPSALTAILRHLIAVKCLGSVRASDVAGDTAVCLFSGFSGPSFFSSLASTEMNQLNVDAIRESHWQTLRESERISDRCVLAELVSLHGRERLVLRDLVGNEWLGVAELPGELNDLASLVLERLTEASRAVAVRPKLVLLGSSLASRFDFSISRDVVEECAVADPRDPAQLVRLADKCGLSAARLQTLLAATEQELAYFSLRTVAPDLDERLDDTFSLVARAVLRDFSRRVFGFDLSSPEYLYQNFLAGLGSVLCRDEALEVRLPASPLAVILRMAGLQQQKFQPPWLKGREVWLLPPQD
jgi:hypothetical protein